MTFAELEKEWLDDSKHIICHTSGSTGTPSEIRLPKHKMSESAKRTIRFFNLSSNSRLHSCVAPDFIGGKMMFIRAQICNCEFSFEKPSNRPLQNLENEHISLLAVVPSQMIHILDNLEVMPKIDNIIIGGAPLSDALRLRIAESGLNAFETYGMTETASHIAIRAVTSNPTPFKTLEGIEIKTVDDKLIINIKDWKSIQTNDLVRLTSPSEFFVLGRADNAIISGGIKFHPELIESKIAHLLSSDFYITSAPHPKWGEQMVIAIKSPDSTLSSQKIAEINNAFEIAGLTHKPKSYVTIPSLPLTPNGKLRRLPLPPSTPLNPLL